MYKLIRDTIDRDGAYYPEETEALGFYSDLTSVENAVAKNYAEDYGEDYDEVDAEFQFRYDNVWIFIDPGWIIIYHAEITSEGA